MTQDTKPIEERGKLFMEMLSSTSSILGLYIETDSRDKLVLKDAKTHNIVVDDISYTPGDQTLYAFRNPTVPTGHCRWGQNFPDTTTALCTVEATTGLLIKDLLHEDTRFTHILCDVHADTIKRSLARSGRFVLVEEENLHYDG